MEIKWYDKEILDLIKANQTEAMKEVCQFLVEDVKDSMVAGTGEWYRSKKGDGSWHQAATPGVPPAPDTEELKDSICWSISNGETSGTESGDANIETPGIDGLNVEGRVGTTNSKGGWQELGLLYTKKQIPPQEKARPFLRPSLEKNSEEIINILGSKKI